MVGFNLDIPEIQEGEEPATEKQKNFIKALMRDVGGSGFPEETLQDLGKWQASSIIDQLQSFKAQLAGDKPLDSSKVVGLDEGGNKAKWIIAAIIIVVAIYLLF